MDSSSPAEAQRRERRTTTARLPPTRKIGRRLGYAGSSADDALSAALNVQARSPRSAMRADRAQGWTTALCATLSAARSAAAA